MQHHRQKYTTTSAEEHLNMRKYLLGTYTPPYTDRTSQATFVKADPSSPSASARPPVWDAEPPRPPPPPPFCFRGRSGRSLRSCRRQAPFGRALVLRMKDNDQKRCRSLMLQEVHDCSGFASLRVRSWMPFAIFCSDYLTAEYFARSSDDGIHIHEISYVFSLSTIMRTL